MRTASAVAKSAALRVSDAHVTLDFLERALMVALFFGLNYRILLHLTAHTWYVDLCLLLSEATAMIFVVTHRRTKTASLNVGDWVVTLVGTALPTLVIPSYAPNILPMGLCAVLMAIGFMLQISGKLTLRRSFGLTPANRGVKTSGPYHYLRHPIYAGYVLTQLAFLGVHPNLWNLAIYAAAFAAQCFRIRAEERLLSADPAYRSFMQTTRWRLLPFIF
jgi:protein-S-isoprenylcysteine O-methyltransferase Ste14